MNVLATFIAIAYVDRFGRKPLLKYGLIGMCGSLALVGIAFASFDSAGGGVTTGGTLTLIGLVVFIISFAFSLGPVVWTVISEIYPSRVRGRAVSVATAANWGAAFLVTQFFLTIVDAIGEAETFFLFAGDLRHLVHLDRPLGARDQGPHAGGDPDDVRHRPGRRQRRGRGRCTP